MADEEKNKLENSEDIIFTGSALYDFGKEALAFGDHEDENTVEDH